MGVGRRWWGARVCVGGAGGGGVAVGRGSRWAHATLKFRCFEKSASEQGFFRRAQFCGFCLQMYTAALPKAGAISLHFRMLLTGGYVR